MGKLPPEGIFSQIGFVSAILFVVMWIALPFITAREKKV
jgi:ubiquinol-cytochrome c reductase cytochrome b subunit